MLATQAAHETIAELAKELVKHLKHPQPGRTLAILRELDTETTFIDRAILTDTGLPRTVKAVRKGHASSSEIKRLCKSLRSKWKKILAEEDAGGEGGSGGGGGGSGRGSEAGGKGEGEGTIIMDLSLEEELRAHKELLRGASGGSGASANTGSTAGSKDHLGQALSSRTSSSSSSSSATVVDLTLDSPTTARTQSTLAVVGGSSESGTSLDQILRGAGVEEEEEERRKEEEEVDEEAGEEVPCTVCGCQWDSNDDQMLICSGCDTLAHQWCYGVSGSIEDLPDLWYVLLRVLVVKRWSLLVD